MTTRDETALAIARAVNDWMLDAETTAPFLVSEEEELARTITPLISSPPAPAAITEDVTIRLPREQADAIRAGLLGETLVHFPPGWRVTLALALDAALDAALDSAAPAQSGGERNKE